MRIEGKRPSRESEHFSTGKVKGIEGLSGKIVNGKEVEKGST